MHYKGQFVLEHKEMGTLRSLIQNSIWVLTHLTHCSLKNATIYTNDRSEKTPSNLTRSRLSNC
jgi:hypothetical protein